MKINFNFSKKQITKINGDVVFQINTQKVLNKNNFSVEEGQRDLLWFLSFVLEKIGNLLIKISLFSFFFKNNLNFFIRSKNYKFSNYHSLTFSHYFYNFNKNIKKIVWSTQGIMNKNYYKNYNSKVTIENDIKLYKYIDRNKKTIFLFWDKKFALRTKKICKLKSVIKIIPPTLSINEKLNKRIKTKVKKKIKILFIGKAPKIKGLFYLLKAFENDYLDKFDYHLNIVSNLEKVKIKNTTFHRNISEKQKNQLLKEADIFILPSVAETFGYSLMEAIANKCAIITCNYYPLITFCKNNHNGYLVKKYNSKDISKSLIKLFKDRKKLENFKENSFKLYEENFSQMMFIKRFKKILNEYNLNKFKSDI